MKYRLIMDKFVSINFYYVYDNLESNSFSKYPIIDYI